MVRKQKILDTIALEEAEQHGRADGAWWGAILGLVAGILIARVLW